MTVWSQMIPSVQGSEAFLLKGAVAGLPGVCVGILIPPVAPCSSVVDAAGSQRGFRAQCLLDPMLCLQHRKHSRRANERATSGSNLIFSCFFFFKSHELVLCAGSV